jgi:PAS domain S-box-containing protein
MPEILVPLTSEYTLIIPSSPRALIGWVIGLIAIVSLGLYLRDRSFRLDRQTLIWLAVLSVLILILTPFVGVLPRMSPDLGSGEVPVQHLMFFAAIPWMMAGGMLGVLPAAMLAGISGLLLAYLDTHNIFTPLVMMSVAILFSWCVRQRYRTAVFKWLRFPIIAAVASFLASAPFVFLALVLSASGSTGSRVALAMARFPVVIFSLGGMVLIGGVVSVIVQAIAHQHWGLQSPLRPAPGEVYFRYRLIGFAVPIFVIVLAGVLISTWSLAQSHASRLMLKQLTGTTGTAAEGLGLFLEAGERLIQDLAMDPQLISAPGEQISPLLDQSLEERPFFDWMVLLDLDGNIIAGVSQDAQMDSPPIFDLADPIALFSQQNHAYSFPAGAGDGIIGAQVGFWAAVGEQPSDSQRLLWGQTVLETNSYARPFIAAFHALMEQGGGAAIVGSDGTVYLQIGGEESVVKLPSANLTTATFYQSTTQDGLSLAQFFQPVAGTNLGITATMPAQVVQDLAWEITRPNLLIAAGVMSLLFLSAWIGLLPIVKDMEAMTLAFNAVAVGDYEFTQLEKRLSQKSGTINTAFMNMVDNQKNRLDRQDKLLSVSGRVAGQLNLRESLHMIMAAALLDGVSAVRIVMPDSEPDENQSTSQNRYGLGQQARLLASLDQMVTNLAQKEGLRVLHADEIVEKLPIIEDISELTSVVIIPLKWKDLRLGVFWVAFSDRNYPDGEVVKYLHELAQVASMAMINAKTAQDSQFSSVLLAAIFDLFPDAVLVADHHGEVLFHNPAADDLFGITVGKLESKTLSALLTPEDFMSLGVGADRKSKAKEVHLHDGKTYELISSPIQIDLSQPATAMIFKDLTQQRKANELKTEFVTTVSHELRSPLTLILGYAKILRLTGNLNEQQDVYIGHIIDGVEEMKSLVQKLLDIGRLESGDSLEIRQFSAEQITKRVVDSLEAQARQKNISISVNLPDEPILIEGDQTFLTQALKNLLENALKFSKLEGEVAMSVRESDKQVIFAVQDKGIGIAPLDQRNLFKKFSRISAQAGMENEGSGLGLAIVKSIAERHGGGVRLESQLGKGSTFYFEIPRKQNH